MKIEEKSKDKTTSNIKIFENFSEEEDIYTYLTEICSFFFTCLDYLNSSICFNSMQIDTFQKEIKNFQYTLIDLVTILCKYNCYMSAIRGHRNQETGKLQADWTTLFNPSIKYEFEEYKGDSISIRSFGFNTKEECTNFVNYCDSDIVMFAIYLSKTSFNINSKTFNSVPCMPTYIKAWTDDEIAKEIGLTDEEVAYIHEEMKDFGYKAMK